jgi:hypothetical protein
MCIGKILIYVCLAAPVAVIACGDNGGSTDADPFDSLQACFDEHTKMESLPVGEAIVVCCTDHPIAGVHPSCKDTKADCVTHVRAELDSSITNTQIDAACTDYITKK